MVFTFRLARLDLAAETFLGETLGGVYPDRSIGLSYNGFQPAVLQARGFITVPALVLEKIPVQLRAYVFGKLGHG
jgi:hypothetical protein